MSESHQKAHDKKENLTPSSSLSYQDFIVAVGTKKISYKIVSNVQLKLPEDTVDGSFIKLYSIFVFLILFSFIASFPILAIIWKQWNILIGISIQAGLFLVYTLIYKLIQFKTLLINALYSLTVFLTVFLKVFSIILAQDAQCMPFILYVLFTVILFYFLFNL